MCNTNDLIPITLSKGEIEQLKFKNCSKTAKMGVFFKTRTLQEFQGETISLKIDEYSNIYLFTEYKEDIKSVANLAFYSVKEVEQFIRAFRPIDELLENWKPETEPA